jgi:hypothetical protein
VLKSSVEPAKREEWIARHAPGCDVAISHPKLVETGLDLFDKGGRHNFATLIFYELPGFDLYTLRQASRRSWRIGETLPCRVRYLYYAGTAQARALFLMGEKLLASQALEGQFSAEGLTAMIGDDNVGSMEMALAKSLAERMNVGDARRVWRRVGAKQEEGSPFVEPAPKPPPLPQPQELPPLTGKELCALMRRCKVTIKDLAKQLKVTQVAVKAARKNGTSERTWLAFFASLRAPEKKPVARTPSKKTAVQLA